MLRNRKQKPAATEPLAEAPEPMGDAHEPDVFDEAIAAHRATEAAQVVNQVAAGTEMPERTAHIANPSSTRTGHAASVKRREGLHDVISIPVGDMKVQLIDKGDNRAGIGVRVVFPEGRKPSDDEKAIIRGIMTEPNGDGYASGFQWKNQLGMWLKEIGQDSPASRAVAIRMDAESRVKRLAEDLRLHQADPAGFADAVTQRREQAANSERIPD